MGSLIPDVGNVSINTTGALNNLMKAYDNFGAAIASPGDRITKLADKQELRDRLEKEDALRAEALAYSRGRDAKNDLIAKEDRDYLLGQRKNKEDFMKSISEPGVDALDDTIIKRTNDLAASKWNEANPISDADAAKLNDYYAKNQKILAPTLDPENLRSYIGSQALKYGVDPSTATSTYEMFKPDKKETGITDMEKLLIQNELGMQRDVNKLNAEKALGNEKYDGRSGNGRSGSSSRKNADGSEKNLAAVLADASKIKTEDSWMNSLNPFVKSESEDVRDLAQKLYNENYDGKDIVNVLTSSVVDGKLDEDRLAKVLKDVKIPVSKSDAKSTTGALEKVEYTPAIDLQSMIAKSTKVDKGKLAEDMFEREFGIPKGKSGGIGSTESYGKLYDGTIVERNKEIPLTVQFNNPGAIKQADKKDSTVKWKGQIGVDSQGHAIFDTPLSGAEAQVKNMLTQAGKDITLGEMVRNYATGNQQEYIDKISKETGIKENDIFEEEKIGDIVLAMSKFEAGSKNTPYTKSLYEQALSNVGKERSIKLTNALDKVIDTKASLPKAPEGSDNKDISSNEQNQKEKDEFETKISDIRNQFQDKRSKLNDDLQLRFKNGDLSYFDNTLSKIGKQKEQRDLDNEEKNSIKNLVNMSKDKNGTKLTKYEEMENDAKEYDKKEKEDSIVKKQIQLQINELKNDPSIVNEYESAWRSEARKRGLQGTDIRPFSINEFIKSLTPEKINEIRNKYQ